MEKLTGGCLCKAITYEIHDLQNHPAYHETNCYCNSCAKQTGGIVVSWFSVLPQQLKILSGTPTSYQSSARGRREFCSICGSSLFFSLASEDITGNSDEEIVLSEIDVTVASLDAPIPKEFEPKDHVFTGSKPSWWCIEDGKPMYSESRTN